MTTSVFGEIPNDIKDKPLLGLYDPVTHAAVAAQAGTTVTDNTNSVVYAPLASSGSGGGGGGGAITAVAGSYSAGALVDGASVTQGAKGDSAATDGSSSWSGVALLKGILTKLLGSIAVTGIFWQATQPVSMASIPTSQAGTIAPAASQPTITVANTDTAYTLSQQARRFLVQNNSTANVSVELDASTSTASVVLLPSASWSDPIAVTAFHFLTVGAVSINNGTTGIIVKGWL